MRSIGPGSSRRLSERLERTPSPSGSSARQERCSTGCSSVENVTSNASSTSSRTRRPALQRREPHRGINLESPSLSLEKAVRRLCTGQRIDQLGAFCTSTASPLDDGPDADASDNRSATKRVHAWVDTASLGFNCPDVPGARSRPVNQSAIVHPERRIASLHPSGGSPTSRLCGHLPRFWLIDRRDPSINNSQRRWRTHCLLSTARSIQKRDIRPFITSGFCPF